MWILNYHHLYIEYVNIESIITSIFGIEIQNHHHLNLQYVNTETSSIYSVWEYRNIIISILSTEILNHHHLYQSSGQRDLISASKAIWLHNLAEQSAMYSASAMLRETLDYFLLNHELIADLI